MKKFKILILNQNLMAGGIETSFINFIHNVKEDVDIDAYLCNKSGVLKDGLPPNINVIEGNKLVKYFCKADSSSTKKTRQSKLKVVFLKIIKLIKKFCKLFGINKILRSLAVATTKSIRDEYDCVICFGAQHEICCKIALKKTKGKQKWAFIHCDVSKFDIGKKIERLLNKYDKILCVSQSCAEIFKNKYPHLAYKVDYLYNFQNNEKIKTLSSQFEVEYPQTFNIVTVARLSELEKGIIRSLEVYKTLHDEGYRFHWHIVGDGGDRKLIENFIETNKMSSYVTLHGNQSNPYPYIKSADLFYLGSYHESWGIVLIEALVLGIPILTTRTSSSNEILGDKCFICENNKEAIFEKLKFILDNKHLLEVEKEKIKNYTFDNESNKIRFLKLIEKEVKEIE